MKKILALAAAFFATASIFAGNTDNGTPKQKYDVAAFVWPSYHPDDRAKLFWPEGIGEWQTVMKNDAKFPTRTAALPAVGLH